MDELFTINTGALKKSKQGLFLFHADFKVWHMFKSVFIIYSEIYARDPFQ